MTERFKAFAAAVALLAAVPAQAAEPAGYYSSCENKGGQDLLSALCSKIGPHTTVSYDGLLTLYKTSDVRDNGTIWDMYSTKEWRYGTTCGNYSKIGDCYNREHSFPKSWFGNASPMASDAFHIYPTDGKVNGQRSNYPYGECERGTYVASSGSVKALGKLGASTFPGYSGTVFEPDDEYKGDFARSYFYMAACYNDRIAGWDSPMLAGNKYPAFSAWTVELLLKWHHMDPVSKKETDRNEVVYGRQKNRNPFIDHPELADYIWGDKKNLKWSASGGAETAVNKPADGSVFAVGITAAGTPVSRSLAVKTTAATGDVTITVGGAGFSVNPRTLSASAANEGAEVSVTYSPASTGNHSATLTVNAGSAKSVVILTGKAVAGIPVLEASDVTDDSFRANWTYVGDDNAGSYTLDVRDAEGSLDGYPREVDAQAGSYVVAGLMPETAYSYTIAGKTLRSETINLTTGAVVPSIEFLYDGKLEFSAETGQPSAVAEILIAVENIDKDYTISVTAPFEISLDNSEWSTQVTATPDDSRLYMRLNSDRDGTFETVICAVCGDYVSDDASVRGTSSSSPSFFEDFEPEGLGTYNGQTYYGTACTWDLRDAGFWSGDDVYAGEQSLRAGKSGNAVIEMLSDRDRGIGKISFYARRFGSDVESKVTVECSTDGGATWTAAGEVTVATTVYTEYSVFAGVNGKARMRLRETSGKRFYVDNLAITDYSTGLADPGAGRHQWNAYSHGGSLFVDVESAGGLTAAIYALDGSTLHQGHVPQGRSEYAGLTPGSIVIVSVGDFSRTVIIR